MVYYAPGTPEWEDTQKAWDEGLFTLFSQPQEQQTQQVQQDTVDYSPIFQDTDVQQQKQLTGFEGISSAIKGFDPSLTAGQVQFETRNLLQDQNYLQQAGAEEKKRQTANMAANIPQVKVDIPPPVLSQPPEQPEPPAIKVEDPPIIQPPQLAQPQAAVAVPIPIQQTTGFSGIRQAINQPVPMIPGTQTPTQPGVEGQTPAMRQQSVERRAFDQATKDKRTQNVREIENFAKMLDQRIRSRTPGVTIRDKQPTINALKQWFDAAKQAAGTGQRIPPVPSIPDFAALRIEQQQNTARQADINTGTNVSTQNNSDLAQTYKRFGGKFGNVLSVKEILGELDKNPVFRDQIIAEMGGDPNYSPSGSYQQPYRPAQQAAPFNRISEAINQPPIAPVPASQSQPIGSGFVPQAPTGDFGMQAISYDKEGRAYTDSTMRTRAPNMDRNR